MYLVTTVPIMSQPCSGSAGSAGSDRGLASHCRSRKKVSEACDGSVEFQHYIQLFMHTSDLQSSSTSLAYHAYTHNTNIVAHARPMHKRLSHFRRFLTQDILLGTSKSLFLSCSATCLLKFPAQ
jgi:hypothetical protein